MSTVPTTLYFQMEPPTVSSQDAAHQVVSNTVNASAVSIAWITALGDDAPVKQVFVTLEAKDQDIWVRFGSSATTGTTSSNGRLIKADMPGISFYVDPEDHAFIDAIAAGASGILKVQVSSPENTRERC